MEADRSCCPVQQAHGDEVKFGNQDDGSRSTRHHLMPMRQIGATRAMLGAAGRTPKPATR
jgi:isoquinoline 1-oxidoreductase beta subunit